MTANSVARMAMAQRQPTAGGQGGRFSCVTVPRSKAR
jgi:hypothetical protein